MIGIVDQHRACEFGDGGWKAPVTDHSDEAAKVELAPNHRIRGETVQGIGAQRQHDE